MSRIENTKYLSKNIIDYPDDSGLRYSKSTIRKAGNILRKEKPEIDERDDAMFVLSNYRGSHESALFRIASMLSADSLLVDSNAIVAKRFKRTHSIIKKLQRFTSMDLDRMQDIAGCRAILGSRKKLDQVKRKLKRRLEFRIKDYILNPKEDGYRGVHLICKCSGKNCNQNFFVEVQLRTKVQHSWATAVEIVDLLTNQKLKSSDGKKEWLTFFRIIGNAFEAIEAGQGSQEPELISESVKSIRKMKIHEKFSAFAQSLKSIENQSYNVDIGYNLILINLKDKTIEVVSYSIDDFKNATKGYLDAERKASASLDLVTALVATESVINLKEAYPNYFIDSSYFLENIKMIESIYDKMPSKSLVTKLIKYLSGFEDRQTRDRKLN